MAPSDLQSYIRSKIPLAEFMKVTVVSLAAERVELSAPLEPNLNVHGTLFGGSAASLALLAAWALAFLRVEEDGLSAPLVVRGHHMTYLKPVTGSATAIASFSESQAWPNFAAHVRSTGRGRVTVKVSLQSQGEVCAHLSAEFAVSRGA
jgi:thioesterase domain-containing protein